MRVTPSLIEVAQALMAEPDSKHWGYSLSRASGVRSGVMYPILKRMLEAEWLTDGWEDAAQAAAEKRPPRRFYEVTELGRRELGSAIRTGQARQAAREANKSLPALGPTPRLI